MSARFRSPAALAAVTGVLALGVAGCASQGVVGASGSPAGTPKAPASSGPAASGSGSAPQSSAPASSSGGPTSAAPASSAPASSDAANAADLTAALQKLNTLWKDPGCKLGLHGFGDYMTAFETSPDKGNSAIPGAIHDLRAGAGATKRPDAAKAMSDMAKDLQGIADATKAGKPVDRGPLRNDWTIMGNTCG
jgi:hypothetical protein